MPQRHPTEIIEEALSAYNMGATTKAKGLLREAQEAIEQEEATVGMLAYDSPERRRRRGEL